MMQGSRGEYVRPWQSPVEPLRESKENIVIYPSDEELNGLVHIGFRAPNDISE